MEQGKWIIGVSYDRGWPVFRIRDMLNPNDQAEVEAARKLFEAAPALLALCQDALKDLEYSLCNDNFAGEVRKVVAPTLDKLEAAIALTKEKQ